MGLARAAAASSSPLGLVGYLPEPVPEQPGQGGGDLEDLAGGQGRACGQDPGQFQRVERIAAAHLLQAQQTRPRQRQPEPLPQQLVQDTDGQGTHPQD